jgi:hypothetical protein
VVNFDIQNFPKIAILIFFNNSCLIFVTAFKAYALKTENKSTYNKTRIWLYCFDCRRMKRKMTSSRVGTSPEVKENNQSKYLILQNCHIGRDRHAAEEVSTTKMSIGDWLRRIIYLFQITCNQRS